MQRENEGRSLIAYVAPLACYMIPTVFEASNWLGLGYEAVCTLKGVLAGCAYWVFRRYYPVYSTAGFPLAIFAGVLGLLVWIGLDQLQGIVPGLQQWVQTIQGSRVGYNPFSDGEPTIRQLAFVVVRLLELMLVVPLIEEVFWRGFLSRYLISEDFEKVEQGTFTSFTFVLVAVLFASAHTEILAAIAWCLMINWLYAKTKNLWACVLMHAVTNGLLGAYILTAKEWHLW
jgi:uncharacterized protein